MAKTKKNLDNGMVINIKDMSEKRIEAIIELSKAVYKIASALNESVITVKESTISNCETGIKVDI